MAERDVLVPFPDSWATTRKALHGYLLALAAIPRAHAAPRPHWWHVGLEVRPNGLVTSPVGLPDGGSLTLGMDPGRHIAWLDTATGIHDEFPLDSGATASEFGEKVLRAAIALGVADTFDRERFASGDDPGYDRAAAEVAWQTITAVHGVFGQHRSTLDGDPGPIHVWPHGFDMSFEWFGSKLTIGEDGSKAPAQLNLGFYPGEEQPYFYSNPWPFDGRLVGTPLPSGAEWYTEGWNGTLLSYESLLGDEDWAGRLLDYAAAVHRIARPTLMA